MKLLAQLSKRTVYAFCSLQCIFVPLSGVSRLSIFWIAGQQSQTFDVNSNIFFFAKNILIEDRSSWIISSAVFAIIRKTWRSMSFNFQRDYYIDRSIGLVKRNVCEFLNSNISWDDVMSFDIKYSSLYRKHTKN